MNQGPCQHCKSIVWHAHTIYGRYWRYTLHDRPPQEPDAQLWGFYPNRARLMVDINDMSPRTAAALTKVFLPHLCSQFIEERERQRIAKEFSWL